MAALNKVCLIGNVGKDPEVRYAASGDAVANFSLATTEKWKDKNGDKQEHTEWHRIVVWGKLAEIVEKYVTKGSALYVEGKLKTRKWTDKDDIERYSTEVVVHSLQMLGGGQRESEPEKPATRPAKPAAKPAAKQDDQPELSDDIPF